MKKINIIFFSLVLLLVGACTENFDEIAENPNSPEQVTPSLLLTNASLRAVSPSYGKTLFYHAMIVRQIVWTERAESRQYYRFNRSGFGRYASMRTVQKMVQEADRTGEEDAYAGIGHFFNAWHFYHLTMAFGDIPYKEALLGEVDAKFNPVYDTQEDVFIGILKELDQANTILANTNGVLRGDVVYDGNIILWRKVINSFTLKVLMSLSNKEGASQINIAQKFAEIVGNPDTYPIFTSNDDNMQLKFSDTGGERYPFWNTTHKQYPHMDEFLTEIMKKRQDKRLFYYAAPTQQALDAGLQPDDFDAYTGGDGTDDFNIIAAEEADKSLSRIHSRYYEKIDAEPYVRLGYWEQEFTIAEAAQRGWIADSAEEHYKKGIRANMQFYRDNAISYEGVTIDDAYIDDYLNGTDVAYDPTTGIEQILTQKYIASFLNSSYTFYYNYRRTGFPNLPINPATSLNTGNENMIPTRWRYPQKELEINTENVEAAIKRQYGEDDVNKLMWLLK